MSTTIKATGASRFSNSNSSADASSSSGKCELRVMSFNIWGGGVNQGKDVSETVSAIQLSGADIVGIQETRAESNPDDIYCPPVGPSASKALAKALGFFVLEQTDDNFTYTHDNPCLWASAILSRYPIVGQSTNALGAEIDISSLLRASGRDGGGEKDFEGSMRNSLSHRIWVFNIHLDDAPYQPLQLLGVSYGPYPLLHTPEEAVESAIATRGRGVELLEEDLGESYGAAAVFITGDFNEPSHRDWTPAAVAAGLHPVSVEYPTCKRLEGLGFIDSFRHCFPDPVQKPGMTWSSITDPHDPEDKHDRVDYVFARGESFEIIGAGIVGEDHPYSDIVVTPWPSDHRATFAHVRF